MASDIWKSIFKVIVAFILLPIILFGSFIVLGRWIYSTQPLPSEKEQQETIREIENSYHSMDFKGEVKDAQFYRKGLGQELRVSYTYTEQIDGNTVGINLQTIVLNGHDFEIPYIKNKKQQFKQYYEDYSFHSIMEESLWMRAENRELRDSILPFFEKTLGIDVLDELHWFRDNFNDSHLSQLTELYKEVEVNKANGRGEFGGFYHVDMKKYIENGLYDIDMTARDRLIEGPNKTVEDTLAFYQRSLEEANWDSLPKTTYNMEVSLFIKKDTYSKVSISVDSSKQPVSVVVYRIP